MTRAADRAATRRRRRSALRPSDADLWRDVAVAIPLRKQAISLRVDEDVLTWFRNQGPRYQSRMNAVLRSYMDAVTSAPRRRTRA